MTREEAKRALAVTLPFKRVGDRIALREVGLIEAVRAHEAKRFGAPNVVTYSELQPSRPS